MATYHDAGMRIVGFYVRFVAKYSKIWIELMYNTLFYQ
ncbi:hypothetical protein VA7868_00484 [Vibrio aerogenes CECT 7868]|uniref:Uncharacterized protein n=1 Tax=Vibrio aerogenes CECT 7868 TaxID=1216006 RepID=A0A1M5VSG8_9VIBR|nr:hypothetical protein VA7868_00484 [Vibrio aerogenes CECT 7868]